MTRPIPTGAWDLWRDEVRAGRRHRDTPDALFFAALCDANGLDRLDEGEDALAAIWFTASSEWMVWVDTRAVA